MSFKCKCGSNKDYQVCCGIYINDNKLPDTPEQLMRSRYTAYTMANIDYIVKTMQGKPLVAYDQKESTLWAQSVIWQKLEVLNSSMNNDQGVVEFKAYYNDANRNVILHEISQFRRKDGRWYYIDGEIIG
ncbi:YchJ family protein [Aquella oligotrophica]|uniref:Preprotein translocase subunit SecA n=1 Tax=Aquella oligotrophica TaxID=2067065 RepID=A0A2I7N4C7_9NEIS|nr:YchJ family metal-binding protein [Aquella oligotrophica]AUR51314.1 preprotein translocase subunit SecA [Aquella oligotrophica]